jgi:carboxyl-terminal processing protease
MTRKVVRRYALFVLLVVAVHGCGGGGGSSSSGNGAGSGSGSGAPADPVYTVGRYDDPSVFQNRCAQPRTGTDPYNNNAAYPDMPGSVVWENSWIRAWVYKYYLWYQQLPDLNPSSYTTTKDYFAADKTMQMTSSGTYVDKFHFTYVTSQWEQLSQGGVSVDYGAHWVFIATKPPRKLLVGYIEPNSSASSHSVVRGASVLKIDGIDLVNANDTASINSLNAAIYPASVGESHTFTLVDTPGSTPHDVSLTAAALTSAPVMNVKTFTVGSNVVGYFQFNDHIATAELGLFNAINQLQASHANELIIDIRYNGGGYLAIASELAYMVAGSAQTAHKTFEKTTFNDKYPSTDPITGAPLTPTPFYSTGLNFSVAASQNLPSLNLSRVFLLVGPDTCSASESIINSLRGINVDVIIIGNQTCGKPYGFYPQDNCGTTYFSIQFKGVNDKGFGDYTDGFVPQNAPSSSGVPIDGCAVADDFTHDLGDVHENRLATALAYVSSGAAACPAPTSDSVINPVLHTVSTPHMVKPLWLRNRIIDNMSRR